jgi:hypothetical protein
MRDHQPCPLTGTSSWLHLGFQSPTVPGAALAIRKINIFLFKHYFTSAFPDAAAIGGL